MKMHKISKRLLVFALCLALLMGIVQGAFAETTDNVAETAETTEVAVERPSSSGKLHVEGTYLADENGNTVSLQGVSLHGLTWFPKMVNEELFEEVSGWGANLIRLPVYSEEYVNGAEEESMELVEKGIEYAVQADMYVLVDWHILDDSDPNTNMAQAIVFFQTIAKKYANVPNIIYEICNEPNGETTWEDIKEYAQCVIPVIKSYNEDAVIVVGTPDYDRDLLSACEDPIIGYSNIMYTFHFYAASHKEEMRQTLKEAIDSGLPVFVTECGLCEDTGDGEMDCKQAAEWFTYLQQNKIAYAIWSLSNKEETSAMIRPGVQHTGAVKDSELTTYGLYVKALLGGQDPATIAVQQTESLYERFYTLCRNRWIDVWKIMLGVMAAVVLGNLLISAALTKRRKAKQTYDDYFPANEKSPLKKRRFQRVLLLVSTILSLVYLCWRVLFSVPLYCGAAAIAANVILLIAEVIGFAESQIHYHAMLQLRDHPLPKAEDKDFPDVDIFIATYNEPAELLRKTVVGCKHIRYPDLQKVHIYLCDDNRRPQIRALAEELEVGYFDRPDNKGAKAGNLNHAMSLTSSPYVVTLDADMIPMEDFLMETIPYYIDAEKRGIPLGLIQTPQCFYTYDVFQHNLYAEENIPDEQDFFYRTIEPAKTATNSVIYGGSNTILSRKALEAVGGFYTKSITEDFATGMLIEAHGFVSLGLPTPHVSGMAPATFEEHIQQRTRWGRGVLVTAKKLKFMRNKNLTMDQKLSYLSSVVYWFSPLFNMIYLLSPLVYAVLGVSVFRCTCLELLLFWLPMFIAQNISLHVVSAGSMSVKWSSLQEISVMPFLFVPVLQELAGISLTTFKVTDKSKKNLNQTRNRRMMIFFAVLSAANIIGIVRVCILLTNRIEWGLFILLYWMVRSMYFMVMSLFLVDGRDSDGENVKVNAAEEIDVNKNTGEVWKGTTTRLTEHNVQITVNRAEAFYLGERIRLTVRFASGAMELDGAVVQEKKSRNGQTPDEYTVEILDFNGKKDEYVNALYNRLPTMPQSLKNDAGILRYLLRNFARRMGNIRA